MTPMKPVVMLDGHISKREIARRTQEEQNTMSGSEMIERSDVKGNIVAHKEFLRIRRMFRAIGKDDELYSQAINDYCLLHSECINIQAKIDRINADLNELDEHQGEMEYEEYFKLRNSLYEKELKYSSELDKKRAAKRQIEDKNLMNIQSALRSIPKAPETKTNALREALLGTG